MTMADAGAKRPRKCVWALDAVRRHSRPTMTREKYLENRFSKKFIKLN